MLLIVVSRVGAVVLKSNLRSEIDSRIRAEADEADLVMGVVKLSERKS